MKYLLIILFILAPAVYGQDKPVVLTYELKVSHLDAIVKVYDALQNNGFTVTHEGMAHVSRFTYIQSEKVESGFLGGPFSQVAVTIANDKIKISICREVRGSTITRKYPKEEDFNDDEKALIVDLKRECVKEE